MSASPDSTQPGPASRRPPTDKQLRYLRNLAMARGESFAYPSSVVEASAEIERLRQRRPSSYSERRIERLEVSRDMAARGDAASVLDSEIVGYGSDCRWSHQR